MLRDVFYYGKKPNVHPKERPANNLADARKQATTEHFWIINEFCDYTNFDWDFDFEFLPDQDVWAENHNNVWPSVHQKDSGTWLCPKAISDIIVYRADVESLKRKNVINDSWKLLDHIDTNKWDFSWHPDPTDPPFVYKWGSKYAPVELKTCIEYHCVDAIGVKYMDTTVELLPNLDCIVEVQKVDHSRWDMSWRPDPMDPPFIYVWGNKYINGRLRSTLEYHVPSATEKKYMNELVPVVPEWDRWEFLHDVDKTTFDFTWRPDPREPDFIYVFGNEQYDGTVMPTIEYRMPNATVKKYNDSMKARLASHPEKFQHLEKADGINYSWTPDPTAPPYIYAWGNQWNKPEDKVSIQYVVEGATEYKYMSERAKRKPCMDNWEVPDNTDTTGFDFSWEPSPADPAYIYEFGTQHQKTGGPRYVAEGATEVKYVEFQKAKALVSKKNWTIPSNLDITGFDFSWHPDATSPPYIYHFATQWALTGGPIYTCENAIEVKYLESPSAIALADKTNWQYDPKLIDENSFDFSWHPYIEDQPYVYVFGTQHQKTGGPRYVTPGAISTSPVKYIDTRVLKATRLTNRQGFAVLNNYKIKDFDWSWHPDETDEPYIYVFGNNLHSAEIMPTIEYVVEGATQIKYVNDMVATLDIDMTNWEVPDNVDTVNFDFGWKPNPKDPPYVYQFGTQHQKTGGPRYIVPDATEVKYIDTVKAVKLADKTKFAILGNLVVEDFDYSWHPDDTEEPYIYVFGNNQYPAEIMPTVEYAVPGAKSVKYINSIIAKLGTDKTNWEVPSYIDATNFDFSWKPNPKDPAYIYKFGTQHQKTGGPKYAMPDATEVKYVDGIIANALPQKKKFAVLDNLIIENFDWSWHPDDTDEAYIYVFGNTQYPAEIMPTIEYAVDGATQIKYVNDVVAKLGVDMSNWEVPKEIDKTEFDFSWRPNPKDPAYIYEFGTQWQKTGGPRYIVPDATEVKYIDTQKVIALPRRTSWIVPKNLDITGFDFSWHPDATSPPYIYHFATQWALTGGPVYKCEGAIEVKYLESPSAIALPDRTNWIIPEDIDASKFDFSWHPYVEDQPYVYQFGTQHQKTGGPRYVTPGALPTSPIKYIDTRILKAIKLPDKKKFSVLGNYNIKNFDWSWHPDDTEEPFIYVFGNNQHPAEIMPTIEYEVEGAKQTKYVSDVVAVLDVDMNNWEVPENVDATDFDFSWKPNPKDPAYVYEFGTQHQKTGGPRYVVPDATETKYVTTQKVKSLPSMTNWNIPNYVDVTNFDFSWHPDATSPPYVYHFATQWALTGGPIYTCEGATETKYLEEPSAIALSNRANWEIPDDIDVDGFDFSWHPYVEDQPYVYQFGTQHQKTGGPRYVSPGALSTSPIKYIDTRILKAKKLSTKENFAILNNYKIKDFDFSWHPDETDEPYIYVFGNNQYSAEIMPTIEYVVPGAKQIKYINDVVATLGEDKTNWVITQPIDETTFDFTWKPNPKDPPYVYRWGNRYISNKYKATIEYIVPDATDIKYMDDNIQILPEMDRWVIPDNIDTTGFDFTWRPDPLEPDLIWEFGTQHQKTGGPRYVMPGATETKYIDTVKVKSLPSMTNWDVNPNIDITDFDFSWHPDRNDPLYIYQFGTQWALSGGPRYVMEGATEVKYIDTMTAKALPNKDNWEVPSYVDATDFDFSWHPYVEDQPYIYQFGTQWQKTGGPRYVTPGSLSTSPVKYIDTRILKAKKLSSRKNFSILNNYKIKDFDYSWHPDETEEPFIYVFGNNLYPAEIMPTVEYVVSGAKEIKYVHDVIATLTNDLSNWDIPEGIDTTDFDFSWKPNPKDPAYIYEFGTQWQKTGGPRYIVPDANEVKYVDTQKATSLPNSKKWEIPTSIDVTGFDFSWHPDATSPPYIYHFATQWALSGGPIYKVEGANEVKYMEEPCAIALPNKENWEIPDDIDVGVFDFSWHPYVEDQPYVYQFGTQHQKTGGPRYVTPGSLATSPVKYIDTRIIKANKLDNRTKFAVLNNYKIKDFDWSWHPDDTDEPYIYVFGNNQHPAEVMPTVEYKVDGATKVKYVAEIIATLADDNANWEIPKDIDVSAFDFSWKPNPKDSAYIYEFGTQHQKTGGPRYIVPDATQVKYVEGSKAKALPKKENWVLPKDLIIEDFDYSWHPDSTEDLYIYEFGTQWHDRGGPRYIAPDANKDTPVKYIDSGIIKATLGNNKKNWVVVQPVDEDKFDYSWVPHPNDPPYIYRWGNKYIAGVYKSTIDYHVPGASEIKYMTDDAPVSPEWDRWETPKDVDTKDFDFSWRPDPLEPDLIWQFGTQWQKTGGPRYVMPEATETKFVDTMFVTKLPNKKHWFNPYKANVTTFDYSWHPDDTSPPYIYQFGSEEGENDGPRYIAPGATGDVIYLKRVELEVVPEPEVIETLPIVEEAIEEIEVIQEPVIEEIVEKCDIFFVDRGNPEAQARFEYLKNKLGNVQKTRYLNSWVDTINRCINRSTTTLCWILNSELDYADFDFNYYPNPYQMKMVHVFGTQWSNWGTTFMVNRDTFSTDTKWIKIIEHLSNLNFVKSQFANRLAKATNNLYDMYVVDHGNKIDDVVSVLKYKASGKDVKTVAYADSYFDTLKKLVGSLPEKKEHYIWVCSSVCDYTNFDFTYICDPFAREQLHVFPSGKQKFGDTFLVNVNRIRELIANMSGLTDYDKINYNQHQRVNRFDPPTIVTEYDSHVASVMQDFDFPYAVFITEDNKDIIAVDEEPMNLWDLESKNILITSTGGTRIIVPKEAKQYVETQLYDYPYIKTASRLAKSNPLDIVYLSNGESCAEENYEHLLKVTKGLPNKIVRVDGVDGRVQAYHAAAEASNTPWMFTVFAKLKINAKFDFNWQPDRLQIPKHYMFLAKNPVNGLIYGHQGMIAYNKQMTLDNQGHGLDFTLDSPHETIELLSGIATYNNDAWSTWRTAFREVIKLKKENSEISLKRLESWLNKAEGNFAQSSLDGAKDGVSYYDEVDGKTDKLKLSYEWAWLRERFNK